MKDMVRLVRLTHFERFRDKTINKPKTRYSLRNDDGAPEIALVLDIWEDIEAPMDQGQYEIIIRKIDQ